MSKPSKHIVVYDCFTMSYPHFLGPMTIAPTSVCIERHPAAGARIDGQIQQRGVGMLGEVSLQDLGASQDISGDLCFMGYPLWLKYG